MLVLWTLQFKAPGENPIFSKKPTQATNNLFKLAHSRICGVRVFKNKAANPLWELCLMEYLQLSAFNIHLDAVNSGIVLQHVVEVVFKQCRASDRPCIYNLPSVELLTVTASGCTSIPCTPTTLVSERGIKLQGVRKHGHMCDWRKLR